MSAIFGLPVKGSDVQVVITRVHLHPLSALVEFWGNFNIDSAEDYQTLSKAIQSPGKYLHAGEGNAGDQCLVQIDGTWYRSRIVLRRGYNYKVFLIDSGLTFCTTCHVLAWGQKEFFRMPPEVECCVLANVLPLSPDNKWSPVAIEFVKSIQGQHVDAHVQEVLLSHRTWLLDIPCISKKMYEMGFAKKLTANMFHQFVMISLRSPSEGSPEQIANPESERLHKQELYMHPEIVAGTVETVVVTEVRSPQRIFCQLKVFSQEVKNISDQMDQCYGGRSANCIVNPEMIGFPCAAKTNDGIWYRSVLQQVFTTDKIVEVLNVDYGTKCLVKMENIRPLSPQFFRMPVVTYICSLHGVIDSGEGCAASQLDYLKSLILHKTVVAKFEYQSISEGVYYITLYGDENINNLFSARGSRSLECEKAQVDYAGNTDPQKHGFGDAFGPGNKVSTWPADELGVDSSHLALVQHVSSPSESDNLLNPVVKAAVDHWSEQAKSAPSNVYAAKDDVFNGVDQKTPFPSGLVQGAKPSLQLDPYIYSSHNIKMGTEEGVTVVCVKSVSQFYCQFERNAGVMEDLKLKVNTLCHQLETAKHPAVLGPICFAKYCDGHWYRGQIVTTQPSMVVHFVDYGDTIKVDKSDLLPVPKEASDIMMVPVQAVLCSLADVPEDVPKEVNKWFETSSTDCKFKAQVVAKESDGKLLVELYHKSVQVNSKIKKMFKIGLQGEEVLNREQRVSANWVNRTHASAPNQQQVRSDVPRRLPSHLANGTSQRRCESKPQTEPTQSKNEGKKSVPGRKVELYRPPHQRLGNGKPSSLHDGSLRRGSFIPSKEQRLSEDRNWRESSSTQSEQKSAVDHHSKTQRLPKIEDLPTKCIIPGTDVDVYVSYCTSPLSLYLQLAEEEKNIFALVDKLNDPSSSPERNITHVEPGDLVQAEFEDDSSWYRAVVREVDSKDAILVEFVDFGNTATVPMSKMARLPGALLELPVYSLHCMLSEAADLKKDGVLDTVLSSFKDTVAAIGDSPIRCKFVKQLGSVWEVSLEGIAVNDEGKQSAASLVDDMVVSPDDQLTAGDSQLDICTRRYLQPDVQEGSQLVVYITNTNKDQTFWCHSADTEALDSITSRVSEVGESADCAPIDISCLSSGSPCVALFPEDSLWYRAEVVDIHGEELSVFYVDYGNKATVRGTDVRKIPQDLLDTPSLAFLCVLEGDESLHGSWQTGVADELVSLAADKELQLTVTKLARDNDPVLCDVKLECEGVVMNDVLKAWWKTCTPQTESAGPTVSSEAQLGDSAVEPLEPPKSPPGRLMEPVSHDIMGEITLTQEGSDVEVQDAQVPCDFPSLREDAEENLVEDADIKAAASGGSALDDPEAGLKSPREETPPTSDASDVITPSELPPKTEKRSVRLIPKEGSVPDGNVPLDVDNEEILDSNLVRRECLEPPSVSPAEPLTDNSLIGCEGAPPEMEVESNEPLPEGSVEVDEAESVVGDVGRHKDEQSGQPVEADDLPPDDSPLVSLLDTQNELVSQDELLPPRSDEQSELMSKAEDLSPDKVQQHLLIEKVGHSTELQSVEDVLQSLEVHQDSALDKDDSMTEDELVVCSQADDSGIPPDDVPQDATSDKEESVTEDLISFHQSDELKPGDPSQSQTEAGKLPPCRAMESKVVTPAEEERLELEPSACSCDPERHCNKMDELVCLFHDISLSEMREGQGVENLERAEDKQEDFNDSLLEEASSFSDEGVDCELQKLADASLMAEGSGGVQDAGAQREE